MPTGRSFVRAVGDPRVGLGCAPLCQGSNTDRPIGRGLIKTRKAPADAGASFRNFSANVNGRFQRRLSIDCGRDTALNEWCPLAH
jgi:hypothetical protein